MDHIRSRLVEPEIVLYMETGLPEDVIRDLLTALNFKSARQLMRRSETDYKDLNLKDEQDEGKLIEAMSRRPRLIERPIVIENDKAVLGRPRENVESLFE